jgi:hypothetical protein
MVDTVLPIANGFYTSDSLPVSAQNCVNLFPHINEVPALNQEILLGTPGIASEIIFNTAASAACRGTIAFGGKVYFVAGQTLFSLDIDNYITSVSSAEAPEISGYGPVSMAVSQSQLMILVPGGAGYIVTQNTPPMDDTIVTITDSDFYANGNPQYVVYVDGYFVCTTDEGGKFICSALNDGLAWNALDFGTAESSPDAAIVPVVCKNQLFIVGSETCEQFGNVPNGAAFPFQRTGLFLSKGTVSPSSVIASNDTFLMIGGGKNESPAVWALEGNSVAKKSTSAIDTLLQQLTGEELAGLSAWAYAQGGHYFVGFGLPETTIVFDLTTNRWHERLSRVLSSGTYVDVPYRVAGFAQLGSQIVVTDNRDGRVGVASTDVYTEYGLEVIRTFATQPFQNNMQPFFVPKLELTVESGVGLVPTVCCFTINPEAETVIATGENISFETAQDVSAYFSKAYNPDIVSLLTETNISTSIPHADIEGEGTGGTTQFYSFTVCDEGAIVYVQAHDVTGFEPFFYIYNMGESVVAAGEEYIRAQLNPGTYYVRVFDYFNDPIPDGATYTLYISVSCFEQPSNAIDPTVRLEVSRDGGKTWGQSRSRPLGKMGRYNSRAVWRRNGRSKRFDVYKFTMSDPVKPVFIQLTCQIEGADDSST